MTKKILGIFLLVSGSWFLVSGSYVQAQEQITITTYYPSPFGSYRDLETQRLAVAYGQPPAIPSVFWNNFLTVKTGYGDTIAIGGDAVGSDAEIRLNAPAARNFITFRNTLMPAPGGNVRLRAANIPGCRVVNYTNVDPPVLCQCGDWNCDGDCTDLGESCTSRLSFVPVSGAAYPAAGWYLCCET